MDIKEKSQQEYISRINRVTNYIDKNVNSPINLATLAGIANFSPFHFHRIFTILTGETPNAYLQRTRMEKAARRLLNEPDISISEVAWSYGFNSVSLFSRTFSIYFGATAKEFRKQGKSIFAHNGLRYSQNGRIVSKNLKNNSGFVPELCPVKLQNLFFQDAKIEIKELPEMKVVYVRHRGAFNLIGKSFEKLMTWSASRGLINFPETKILTVYHDDPAVTAIEKIRQDVCITVASDVKVEGEIGTSVVAKGKYAVGYFEIGKTEFERAWNSVLLWCMENGYQPTDGPTYEHYRNDYTQHPEKKFIVDICIPIKPL